MEVCPELEDSYKRSCLMLLFHWSVCAVLMNAQNGPDTGRDSSRSVG